MKGGPTVTAVRDSVVLDENLRAASSPAPASSARSPARATSRSATTRTRRRRPRRSSPRPTAPATRSRATSPRSRPTARSPCSAGARCRSTRAARRSSPRRSRPRVKSHPAVFDAMVVGVPGRALGSSGSPRSCSRATGTTPTLDDLQEHCRTKIAGYKVPRELHLVELIAALPQRQARLPLGPEDGHDGGGTGMKTRASEMFGIDLPIFAFSHCRDVVAAVSKAGGLGVLGALAFSPEQLEIELNWIDEHVDGKPYGVDVVMPAKYAGAGELDPERDGRAAQGDDPAAAPRLGRPAAGRARRAGALRGRPLRGAARLGAREGPRAGPDRARAPDQAAGERARARRPRTSSTSRTSTA